MATYPSARSRKQVIPLASFCTYSPMKHLTFRILFLSPIHQALPNHLPNHVPNHIIARTYPIIPFHSTHWMLHPAYTEKYYDACVDKLERRSGDKYVHDYLILIFTLPYPTLTYMVALFLS